MQNQGIKNIIFDLGNVICDIDIPATEQAFADAGATKVKDFFKNTEQGKELLERIGVGVIAFPQFCNKINSTLEEPLSLELIKECWNKTILEIQPERIHLLDYLRTKYNTFILSNTNTVHIQKCDTDLQRVGRESLASLVDKAYYSQDMGLLKPDIDIYKQVINENNLIPTETLFIDDLEENIEGAKVAGLKTHHLQVGKENIIELLKDF